MNKWELVTSLKLVLSAIYYRKSKDYWSNFNNEKEQPRKRVALKSQFKASLVYKAPG